MEEKRNIYPMAQAVWEAYRSGENDDETLEPRVLCDSQGKPVGRFEKGIMLFFIISAESGKWSCVRPCWIRDFAHFPVEKSLRSEHGHHDSLS